MVSGHRRMDDSEFVSIFDTALPNTHIDMIREHVAHHIHRYQEYKEDMHHEHKQQQTQEDDKLMKRGRTASMQMLLSPKRHKNGQHDMLKDVTYHNDIMNLKVTQAWFQEMGVTMDE